MGCPAYNPLVVVVTAIVLRLLPLMVPWNDNRLEAVAFRGVAPGVKLAPVPIVTVPKVLLTE